MVENTGQRWQIGSHFAIIGFPGDITNHRQLIVTVVSASGGVLDRFG